MKKALIRLLVPCLFVLISCDSDDPSDGDGTKNPVNAKCLLQKQISPTLTITITRNDKGLPTMVDYAYKSQSVEYNTASSLEYDGSDRLVKITGKDYSFTYEYDAQGKIVLEKYDAVMDPMKAFTYPYERSYTYNASGYLVKIGWDANTFERYEYDANGNLIKQFMQTTTQPEYLATEYLTYDDKKSPYIDFPIQVNTYLGMSEVYAIISSIRPVVSKNNILSLKTYLPDGTPTRRDVTYSYNESGYATSINGLNVSYVLECK
jgi:YD repeat-containing protein